jgi:tRNA-Thr(GGU) m(6)t(6)A37 methyltransferase TsaA
MAFILLPLIQLLAYPSAEMRAIICRMDTSADSEMKGLRPKKVGKGGIMDGIDEIRYRPIGIIRSSFRKPEGTPIQPPGAIGARGTVEVYPQYVDGLIDIDGFSHIILIYHFHLSKKAGLVAKPFLDDKEHGIFAIRGVTRPNPIGISVVRLVGVQDNILHIQDVDIIDGTPLLDIKPYVPEFDVREVISIGWLEKKVGNVQTSKDDGRFIERLDTSK